MNPFRHNNIEELRLAQNKYIDPCFKKLKKEYGQPINIIEIGTCWGGFSVFLAKMFPSSNIHTFDILDWGNVSYIKKRKKIFKKFGINYHKEDCFNHGGKIIKDLLKQKSILLCDGALKEAEFSHFINYIENGSIIMAHDYGKNKDYFYENIANKYWTESFEFDGSKFDEQCENKGFIPFLQNDFEKAVWYIRKKI